MKIKKEYIEKVTLGVLTTILVIYISALLVFFSLFNISQKFLNKKNVYEFISDIDITTILKDELGNELKEFTIIKDNLNEVGISSEGIDEFVNSTDVKKFSADVVTKIFNKVSNIGDSNYQVTNEQISDLFENNIDKLEIDSNLSSNQILQKIENKIPNLVLNINDLLDKFCRKLENSNTFLKYKDYVYRSISILDIIYSDFVIGLIIFVIISLITLLIFIRKSVYKSLKWLSITFIIPSLLFAMISTFIFSFLKIDNVLLNNILNIINRDLIKHSTIYFVIAFIFMLINVILYIVKKYKKEGVL